MLNRAATDEVVVLAVAAVHKPPAADILKGLVARKGKDSEVLWLVGQIIDPGDGPTCARPVLVWSCVWVETARGWSLQFTPASYSLCRC
jgi:hypothetical protein